MGENEAIFMRPLKQGQCEVHDWPTDGLAKRLVTAMRERHGNGGITTCLNCIHRAKMDADEKRRAR